MVWIRKHYTKLNPRYCKYTLTYKSNAADNRVWPLPWGQDLLEEAKAESYDGCKMKSLKLINVHPDNCVVIWGYNNEDFQNIPTMRPMVFNNRKDAFSGAMDMKGQCGGHYSVVRIDTFKNGFRTKIELADDCEFNECSVWDSCWETEVDIAAQHPEIKKIFKSKGIHLFNVDELKNLLRKGIYPLLKGENYKCPYYFSEGEYLDVEEVEETEEVPQQRRSTL